MPRRARSTRNRSRPARPARSVPFPAAPVGVAAPPTASTATVRPVTPRTAATAPAARGIVTDYGYVIGELRHIGIITAAIFVLLLVLWLVIV